ncbi:MAG: cyclodeaminase/cyclohydrolase family protein [Defluviitaleaceae bacterium]|nr:cyclodeaminase/cyclohydrolase family protein [Defluviitaleaceae bacterium]
MKSFLVNLSVADFMAKLASKEPTPGGGSAAALSGVMGISLVQMVASLTLGRKKYADHEGLMNDILAASTTLHLDLLNAIDIDSDAYNQVSAAFGMPKETDEEKAARSAKIQEATIIATKSPFDILTKCLDGLKLAHKAIGKSNTNAASDLGVAATNLLAGVSGAWMNILINLPGIKDETFAADMRKQGEDGVAQASKLWEEINNYVMQEINQ